MHTENTSLKNIAPAGDSITTNEMVIGKSNTYQRTFLIVTGSLLALLVLIAVAGTSGEQHLQSSTHEIVEGGVVLADYQVDSANLVLTQEIFGGSAVSENDRGWCPWWRSCPYAGCSPCPPAPAPVPAPTPAPEIDCDCSRCRCDNPNLSSSCGRGTFGHCVCSCTA